MAHSPNTPSTSYGPIKLKLSLSAAGLNSTPKDPSTPSSKGKGKEKAGNDGVSTPAAPVVLKVPVTNGSVKGGNTSSPVVKLKQPSKPSHHQDQPEAGPSSPRKNGNHTIGISRTPTTDASKSVTHRTSLPTTPLHSPAASALSTPGSSKRTPSKPLGRPKGSKTKPRSHLRPTPKIKAPVRPTAIPPRLLSSAPSTPKPMPPPALPFDTPSSHQSDDTRIKEEPMDDDQPDPLSLPISPSAMELSTPKAEGDQAETQTPDGGKGKSTIKWMRIKRPIRELLNKVMIELRRKDEYAFFDQPVDLDVYPDYLDVIGGEDKMMDLGTMQQKVDANEYRSMDNFENDLKMLVTAAQTFNKPGTTPFNSASRILAHGLKHIERSRPLVRTPSPSPGPTGSESGTPWRGQSTFSGREGTLPLTAATPLEELPPQQLVPEAMLDYPPNSLIAKAIGWNMTGGRRVYSRRQIRARERFAGKWRHWALDGTRDLAELEDPEEVFGSLRSQEGGTSRRVTDWKGLRKEGPWWEFEIGGPTGQPPIPFAEYPRPTPLRQRELGLFEWGVYPEIEAESAVLASRTGQSDLEALSDRIRPIRPRTKANPAVPANFVNVYDGHLDFQPRDILGEMVYGGIVGEAYQSSLERFIKGAMKSVDKGKQRENGDVKGEEDEVVIGLDEYVSQNWRNGILRSGPEQVVRQTLKDVKQLRDIAGNINQLTDRQKAIKQIASTQYARSALKQLTKPENPLDIAPLLVEQGDFLWAGVGGKSGVREGLTWVGKEILRLAQDVKKAGTNGTLVNGHGKRKRPSEDGMKEEESKKAKVEIDSAASSPLTQPPDSPAEPSKPLPDVASTAVQKSEPVPDRPASLRRLRLELVALSKFYPLAALRKMERAEAERLLPPNVRNLMSKR